MAKQKRKKSKKDKAKFSKIIIACLLATVVAFTVAMIFVFCLTEYHTIPDTLVTAFYSFAGSEALFLAGIKFTDTKYAANNKNSGTGDYYDGSDHAWDSHQD